MVEYEIELDAAFHCLADASRRFILTTLAAGPRSVGELAYPLDMSLAAAAKHIQVLEGAGLIRKDRDGRRQVCSLELQPLREAQRWIAEHTRYWNGRLGTLENLLTEPRTDDQESS